MRRSTPHRSSTPPREAAAAPEPGRFGRGRLGRWTLAHWGAALAGVFVVGIALGAAGGAGLALLAGGAAGGSSTQVTLVAADLDAAPDAEAAREAGYALPIDVRRSERAQRAYREAYEEDLRQAPPPPKPETAVSPASVSPDVGEPPAASDSAAAPEPDRDAAASPVAAPEQAGEPADAQATGPDAAAGAPAPARTWLARAQPADVTPGQPILAIVIDDVGVDVRRSRQALRLPGPLTFAFLPYGYDLPEMAASARAGGHEIMVHLPMEPSSPDADPGPNALLTGLAAEEIDRRIAWNLSRFDHYVGVNNHMGSKFTADAGGMRRVLDAVAARGLLYLDSVTAAATQGYRLAGEMGVPHAVRDVFIDHTLETEAIEAQLARAVEIARRQGHAVAIGHPHDETLEVLRRWLPRIEAEGVQLVPISAVVKQRPRAG
ncbi:MAG: divergent polysaccharide deacetylase family protein [Alphaproteobacteria bacterium]|nr:divergent polysaccharide deacetylase family protein [Alphaproteobacteria bacterium]